MAYKHKYIIIRSYQVCENRPKCIKSKEKVCAMYTSHKDITLPPVSHWLYLICPTPLAKILKEALTIIIIITKV